jgi:hypothetical protein
MLLPLHRDVGIGDRAAQTADSHLKKSLSSLSTDESETQPLVCRKVRMLQVSGPIEMIELQ